MIHGVFPCRVLRRCNYHILRISPFPDFGRSQDPSVTSRWIQAYASTMWWIGRLNPDDPIQVYHILVYTIIAFLISIPYRARLFTCIPLQWRHNGCDGVSNHQPLDCLLNRLFRRISKKTSKLRVTGLCAGNSPVTGEFPAEMASNAENVSIWWRHHALNMRGSN